MLFSSLIFLFLFLPAVVFLYHVVLRKNLTLQNAFLTIASLVFYAWGEPKYVLIMVASIILNWSYALMIDRLRPQAKWKSVSIVVLMLCTNIGILLYFKYLSFFVSIVNSLVQTNHTIPGIVLPIGISFFTFQAISYVLDVYYARGRVQRNPMNVAFYISFFPQLIAGPIVRYNSFEKQIQDRSVTFSGFSMGCKRFIIGLSKKVLIANTVGAIADRAFALASPSMGMAWLGAVSYAFQIYFDFSGYSDMAIGLGAMFGLRLPENFNDPYMASSIRDFWKRWHITLSSWFQDYVYVPLGGSKVDSRVRAVLNLFIVWFLTGLWHGANLTFIVWGLWYFLLIMLERTLNLSNKNTWYGHIYTLFFVLIGWVLFRSPSLTAGMTYLSAMFGATISNALREAPSAFVLVKENLLPLCAACCFSTAFPRKLYLYLCEHSPVIAEAICDCFLFACFAASVLYLINSNYNPFIYFNF